MLNIMDSLELKGNAKATPDQSFLKTLHFQFRVLSKDTISNLRSFLKTLHFQFKVFSKDTISYLRSVLRMLKIQGLSKDTATLHAEIITILCIVMLCTVVLVAYSGTSK